MSEVGGSVFLQRANPVYGFSYEGRYFAIYMTYVGAPACVADIEDTMLIELSVVTRNVCDPFVYPTPFELHFSVAHLGWYRNDPDDYIQKMNGTDKDLAAHFTIIRSRGQCLYGAPMDEIFSPVPRDDYMDSIRNDIAEAVDEIGDNTMYLTLNLARVLAYKEEDLVLSKKEGGDWALKNTPTQFHPLIQDAMTEYAESKNIVYDSELAKQYAAYMLDRINRS
jgi:streptomycin 3"-adenylyltransferase